MKAFLNILLFFVCILFLITPEARAQAVIKYSERPNGHNSPYRIPIDEILASPDVYEGTHIQVVGYLNLGFEDDAIYLNKSDYKANKFKKGLWVHINQFKFPQSAKCNKHYVIIDAVFDANDHGHENLWGGASKNISNLRLFNDPKKKQ